MKKKSIISTIIIIILIIAIIILGVFLFLALNRSCGVGPAPLYKKFLDIIPSDKPSNGSEMEQEMITQEMIPQEMNPQEMITQEMNPQEAVASNGAEAVQEAVDKSINDQKDKVDIEPNVWVIEHNRIRNDVNQKAIKWNDQIAKGAMEHARKCKFEHSQNKERMYNSAILGENLAYGAPFDYYDDSKIVKMWEDEKQFYKYPQGPGQGQGGETGHYTQIVNKNVKEFGCACSKCDNSKLCVCRYNPIQMGGQPPY